MMQSMNTTGSVEKIECTYVQSSTVHVCTFFSKYEIVSDYELKMRGFIHTQKIRRQDLSYFRCWLQTVQRGVTQIQTLKTWHLFRQILHKSCQYFLVEKKTTSNCIASRNAKLCAIQISLLSILIIPFLIKRLKPWSSSINFQRSKLQLQRKEER